MATKNLGVMSRVEATLPSRYYFAQEVYDLEANWKIAIYGLLREWGLPAFQAGFESRP